MELSKYIKSESVELNRSAIHFADYNPRKLSDESRKTLKRGIKKFGLVGGGKSSVSCPLKPSDSAPLC